MSVIGLAFITLTCTGPVSAYQISGPDYVQLRSPNPTVSPFSIRFGLYGLAIALLQWAVDPPPAQPIITIRNPNPNNWRVFRRDSTWWYEAYTYAPNGTIESASKMMAQYVYNQGWRARNWIMNTSTGQWVEVLNPQWNNWSWSMIWDPSSDGSSYSEDYSLFDSGGHFFGNDKFSATFWLVPTTPPSWPTEVAIGMDGSSYPYGFPFNWAWATFWTRSWAHLFYPGFPYMVVNPDIPMNYDIYGAWVDQPLLQASNTQATANGTAMASATVQPKAVETSTKSL